MAQFNPNDPRYQRDLQRALAKNSMGRGSAIPGVVTRGVAAAHAGRQQSTQNMFTRLGLASKLSQMQHAQRMAELGIAGKRIGLGEQRLGFNKAQLKNQLQDAKSAQLFGILTGLGGTAFNLYEGNRRAKATAEANRMQGIRNDVLRSFTDAQVSRRRGRTSEGSLMAERFFKGGTL